MTPQEFSAKIKAKYPAYASIDDTELAKKIVAKYPSYANQVNFGTQPAAPIIQNKSGQGLPIKTDNATSASTQAIPDSTTPSTVEAVANTAKSLVSGTVEAGKDIGAAVSAPIVQKAFDSIDKADQQGLGTILSLRQQAKTKGQDTTHYDNLIKNYQISNNKTVADIFPELKKSNEQVLGDFASMALEIIGAGSGLNTAATKTAGTAEKGLPLLQRILKGSAVGAGYGAGFGATGAMQQNEGVAGVIKSTLIGAGTGAIAGGATEGIFGKRSPEEIAAKAARDAANFDKLTGTIVQGKTADIAKAQKALSTIDTTGVKTYSDLTTAINEHIDNISSKVDGVYATSKETKKLPDLVLTVKADGKNVSHNYVEDAITQLEDVYKKTNNVQAQSVLAELKQKAETVGLTAGEVNDLAKAHGYELNAFNANGEAASGLTKQAAENTRKGLKDTSRQMFDNPVLKSADGELTNLIRTRDLSQQMEENVNKLQQKIKEKGWGATIGAKVAKIADLVSGGSLKGMVNYFIPRGEGLKTLNALDLEKALSKNLKKIQKVLESNAPEKSIEEQLQAIIDGK